MTTKTYMIGKGQFFIVIEALLDSENRIRLYLSSVNDSTIDLSSNISQQPLANGDIVADHMYDLPATMSVAGSVELTNESILLQRGDFIEFQSLIERIKSEGILCTVSKIVATTGNVRFSQRKNMALTRISWTERINSLNFTLSFTQALLADVVTIVPASNDQYLPSTTEPQTLNFTDVFLDPQEILTQINELSFAWGLFTEDVANLALSMLSNVGASLAGAATGAIGGATAGAGIGAIVAAIAGAIGGSVVPGAGTVAGGAAGGISGAGIGAAIGAAAGASIGYYLVAIPSFWKLGESFGETIKYQQEQQKKAQSDAEKLQEAKNLIEFESEVFNTLQKLNEYFTVYKVTTNEEQECQVIFDDVSYLAIFTKNSLTDGYRLTIVGQDGVDRCVLPDISSAPSSFDDCSRSNKLFALDQSGRELYFINMNVKNRNDLSNCYLVATKMTPDTFNQALTELIKSAFRR